MKENIRNAKIASADILMNKDEACIKIILDYGAEGNDKYNNIYRITDDSTLYQYIGIYLYRILNVAGANSVHDLAGKPVRVVLDDEGRVDKIGGYLGGRWYSQE
jgi:hypothetical protein